MTTTIRLALGQINSIVGDLGGNSRKILDGIRKARECDADIVSFPELALCGYPPEDLVLKPKFVSDNREKLRELAASVPDIIAVVGFVDASGDDIFNAAAVIYDGEIKGVYRKMLLPNYSVFDEKRYFREGRDAACFRYGNVVFGVNICEDIWFENGPTKRQAAAGAGIIVNINASPFHAEKFHEREKIIARQALANDTAISYVNMVGGQDELVFDGQSMVVDSKGRKIALGEAFNEQLLLTEVEVRENPRKALKAVPVADRIRIERKPCELTASAVTPEPVAEVYAGLKTGLRDYVVKNGFKKVIVGLSGGIDSALVVTLAADALGPENAVGVLMPSRYTSKESNDDAVELARKLGIRTLTIPIEGVFTAYLATLEPHFEGRPKDITEENLQSRVRGGILMALSNKFGWLVLTTGNKSEMSTGYATLYGDMAGGFAVIKDVPKTLVYDLSIYRNTLSHVIPDNVLRKAPTAELRPNQKDTDSLPPYELLDGILRAYVEENKSLEEMEALGFDSAMIRRVMRLVDLSEYKRRQSPPGIKITRRSFGKDRRMPLTNKYNEYGEKK